jgi:hypothetical protein
VAVVVGWVLLVVALLLLGKAQRPQVMVTGGSLLLDLRRLLLQD